MTPGLSDTITRDRFKSWAKLLRGHTATPLVCVAVGHGAHLGQTHVVTCQDIPTAQVLELLRGAVAALEAQAGGAS